METPATFTTQGGSTRNGSAVDLSQPPATKRRFRLSADNWREIASNGTMLMAGWSDSCSGPLLPYIQSHYGIGYTVVACLFIGQMVGFLVAGFGLPFLTTKMSLGGIISLGAVLQMVGYAIIIPAPPFPVLPIAFAVNGAGMGLQDATANAFIVSLPNPEPRLGYLHAVYGLGGVICPLAATAYASHGHPFNFFYACSLGLATLNLASLLAAFKLSYDIPPHQEPEIDSDAGRAIPLTAIESRDEQVVVPPPKKERSLFMQTFRSWNLLVFAMFTLVYVGAEVSMGGWIVTYMIEEKEGGPSAGYVSSGFFGGIAVGRLIGHFINRRTGERSACWLYIVLAGALEFAVWYGKNLIGSAVSVALIGVVLGPIYPLIMSYSSKVLPRHLHTSAIGVIAALGQAGSAIFPFMVGALAQRFTTTVLHPIMIILMGVLGALWAFVPRIDKKRN